MGNLENLDNFGVVDNFGSLANLNNLGTPATSAFSKILDFFGNLDILGIFGNINSNGDLGNSANSTIATISATSTISANMATSASQYSRLLRQSETFGFFVSLGYNGYLGIFCKFSDLGSSRFRVSDLSALSSMPALTTRASILPKLEISAI